MSTISNYGNIAGSTNNYNNTSVDNQKKKANETENTGKTSNFSKTDKNGKITGKTIGQPKLSEKAAKYYEQLKKKYSNMDFILEVRIRRKPQRHRQEAMPMHPKPWF